jgi:hypothetical protein
VVVVNDGVVVVVGFSLEERQQTFLSASSLRARSVDVKNLQRLTFILGDGHVTTATISSSSLLPSVLKLCGEVSTL